MNNSMSGTEYLKTLEERMNTVDNNLEILMAPIYQNDCCVEKKIHKIEDGKLDYDFYVYCSRRVADEYARVKHKTLVFSKLNDDGSRYLTTALPNYTSDYNQLVIAKLIADKRAQKEQSN